MQVRITRHISFVLLISLPLMWGCASGQGTDNSDSMAREGRALFGGSAGGSSSGNTDSSDFNNVQSGWSIVLRSLAGDPSSEEAARLLATTRRAVGRSDVRLARRSSGVAVVLGSYDRPDSPEAKRDLASVRAVTVGGRRPFAAAFLAPPARQVDYGDTPRYNLASVKTRFGDGAIWTLQIGVYNSDNRAEAKEAAERAVVELRQQGEQAFYYHGRTQSMVTIGVFGRKDYDEQAGPKNPHLFTLIEEYPLNLMNGQYPIIVKRPGQSEREQRSMLVRIPDPE